MKKEVLANYKVIFTAFLIGVTAFSVYKFIAISIEKQDLLKSLNQAKEQITALEGERQSLSEALAKEKQIGEAVAQENNSLKGRVDQLEKDINDTKNTIDKLTSEVAALKAEKASLEHESASAIQERDELKKKMESMDELKKAMANLKKNVRRTAKDVQRAVRKKTVDKNEDGNTGFLVKEGKSTYSGQVVIDVRPAETKDAGSIPTDKPQ